MNDKERDDYSKLANDVRMLSQLVSDNSLKPKVRLYHYDGFISPNAKFGTVGCLGMLDPEDEGYGVERGKVEENLYADWDVRLLIKENAKQADILEMLARITSFVEGTGEHDPLPWDA